MHSQGSFKCRQRFPLAKFIDICLVYMCIVTLFIYIYIFLFCEYVYMYVSVYLLCIGREPVVTVVH